MRNWSLPVGSVAFLSACAAVPAARHVPVPQTAAEEVSRLEDRWATAFNARDTEFMNRFMAPEFKLFGSGNAQGATMTQRGDWMRVWLGPERIPYEAKVIDVVVAGNTAVVTLEAKWRRPSYLTDTWTWRDGGWVLIHRHSAPRR